MVTATRRWYRVALALLAAASLGVGCNGFEARSIEACAPGSRDNVERRVCEADESGGAIGEALATTPDERLVCEVEPTAERYVCDAESDAGEDRAATADERRVCDADGAAEPGPAIIELDVGSAYTAR